MSRSEELFARARLVIPGGVNSPVRAFGGVGGTPAFASRGEGAWLVDADGRRFVDLVQSWGALLFGHAREEIVRAVAEAAVRGTSFGAPTEGEVVLAERPAVDRLPLAEQPPRAEPAGHPPRAEDAGRPAFEANQSHFVSSQDAKWLQFVGGDRRPARGGP